VAQTTAEGKPKQQIFNPPGFAPELSPVHQSWHDESQASILSYAHLTKRQSFRVFVNNVPLAL